MQIIYSINIFFIFNLNNLIIVRVIFYNFLYLICIEINFDKILSYIIDIYIYIILSHYFSFNNDL